MNQKQLLKSINILLNIASFNENWTQLLDNIPFRVFNKEEYTIAFIGLNNVITYEKCLNDLFELKNEVISTYSRKTFEDNFIKLMIILHKENRECNENDVNKMFNYLLDHEIKNFEVFNEISGAFITSNKLQIGEFLIYNIELTKEEIKSKYYLSEDKYLRLLKSKFLISINIEARDVLKAHQLAENHFRSFEKIINFIIGDKKKEKVVRIFDHSRFNTYQSIALNKEGCDVLNKLINKKIDVDLEDIDFNNTELGYNKICNLITKKDKKTDIEKRILNSAKLIGESIIELDLSVSLFKLIVAIESMLHENSKEYISASIVSQISECVAFILENETEERIGVCQEFKKIYGKRSAIAHGGNKTISKEDIYIPFHISRQIIINLLTKYPFNGFTKINEIHDHIRKLKFS